MVVNDTKLLGMVPGALFRCLSCAEQCQRHYLQCSGLPGCVPFQGPGEAAYPNICFPDQGAEL